VAESIMSIGKQFNDISLSRTRDLQHFSIEPPPTTQPEEKFWEELITFFFLWRDVNHTKNYASSHSSVA
jgi:hypothetical protein